MVNGHNLKSAAHTDSPDGGTGSLRRALAEVCNVSELLFNKCVESE